MQRIEASIFARFAGALFACAVSIWTGSAPLAQELVLAPGFDLSGSPIPRPVVVIADFAGGLPNPPRNYIMPLDAPLLSPHGLALVAANRALVTQIFSTKVSLIDTASGTRVESYDLPDPAPAVQYNGLGTLAVNPAGTHVLAVSSLDTLWIIPAPFDHTAAVTMLTLPDQASTAQTRAIAFDSATGRAYVALVSGIAVIDPPYTSVAFTIPSSNGTGSGLGGSTGAIALSADNATLVATRGQSLLIFGPDVRIFHAPFTAASVPEVLTIPGANLDGLTFTPDGSKFLVVDKAQLSLATVYAVGAPFSAASTVAKLQFSTGGPDGFEDIDISADGQFAALSGDSFGGPPPLVVLKAPFTSAGFSFTAIDVPQFHAPYTSGSRGAGTARFWGTTIPASPPQVWVDFSATDGSALGGVQVIEGNSGTTDAMVPVNLSGPSAQTVSVDYVTVDGTATVADGDYLAGAGTLTFAPGETTKNIVVKVVGDTKYEYADSFKVVISNPVNAALIPFADTGTVIIVNDDAVVPLAITTTALPNGVTGVPYSFQLMGTGVLPLTWSSSFALPPGIVLDGATGILSGIPIFPATIKLGINLTDPAGFSTSKSLDLTVTGSGIPFLSVSPNPLDFGSQAVGTTSPILVAHISNSGAATLVLGSPFESIPPGSDFAVATGANACTDGQSITPTNSCPIYYTFTPTAAGTRSLVVNIASNAPAAALTLTGVGTGGALPVVSIANAASVVEGNSGTKPMTFAVTLSLASAGTVTVLYAATGGTATLGADYTVAGSGTLTFAPGVTSQNITVNVIGDTLVEPDETIVMTLSAPAGATLGTATATGIILNDDAAGPAVLALLSAPPAFGNQVVGTTGAPRTVTIGNTGGSNLILATPFALIAGGSDFAYTSGANPCTAGQTLPPAANCTLYITFTPSVPGTRTTDVVLSSNAPNVTLTLSGVGIAAPPPPPPSSTLQPIPTLSPMLLALLIALMGVLGWGNLRFASVEKRN